MGARKTIEIIFSGGASKVNIDEMSNDMVALSLTEFACEGAGSSTTEIYLGRDEVMALKNALSYMLPKGGI